MAKPFQSPNAAGKLFPSANPSTLRGGHRASEPREPISRGSSFRPWRYVAWLGFFAAIWLLSYSGCTRIDL